MQYAILGRTGLEVSVMALGAGGKSRLGQAQGASRDDSVALVRLALERGVTLLDTAAVYGTEEIVGEAIGGRRAEVVVSTKEQITSAGAAQELIGGEELVRRVEGSLKRLGTDYVDILHLHGVRHDQYDHCIKELMPALEKLRDAGKIRFTGITEAFNSEPTHLMLDRATSDGSFDVVMVGFNFVNQTALANVLPQANANSIGTLCMYAVRGPLGQMEAATALVRDLVRRGEIDAADIDPERPLTFLLAPEVAQSLSEAAYRFCRHTPGLDSVIVGTGKQAHLIDNLAALDGPPLPQEVQRQLAHVFRNVRSETGEPKS
jgi:L-galactose dehydrogenase